MLCPDCSAGNDYFGRGWNEPVQTTPCPPSQADICVWLTLYYIYQREKKNGGPQLSLLKYNTSSRNLWESPSLKVAVVPMSCVSSSSLLRLPFGQGANYAAISGVRGAAKNMHGTHQKCEQGGGGNDNHHSKPAAGGGGDEKRAAATAAAAACLVVCVCPALRMRSREPTLNDASFLHGWGGPKRHHKVWSSS